MPPGPETEPSAAPRPRTSVVVPVFNRPVFVKEAIESALAQECPGGHEVVVVDDGSTDRTPEVLASFGGRIRAFRQANAGPAVARNRAVAESRGEYVAFLDSDDVWLPGKLDAQVRILDAHPEACLVHSEVAEFFEEGEPRRWTRRPELLGGRVLLELARRNFVHTMTVLARRSCLDAVSSGPAAPFDPAYPPCEDWDLWLRLAERWAFVADPEPRVRTRVHEGGISSDPLVVYAQGCRALAAAADRITRSGSDAAPAFRAEAARWHVKLGRRLVRAERRAEAKAAFTKAVELAPSARWQVLLARLFPKRSREA
ncbi:MAG: hypothetical protein HMLKMBBP_03909 [Planctomycetes bacterium]|nr:hypothetical protein [Planctomycetota bacterium]